MGFQNDTHEIGLEEKNLVNEAYVMYTISHVKYQMVNKYKASRKIHLTSTDEERLFTFNICHKTVHKRV